MFFFWGGGWKNIRRIFVGPANSSTSLLNKENYLYRALDGPPFKKVKRSSHIWT